MKLSKNHYIYKNLLLVAMILVLGATLFSQDLADDRSTRHTKAYAPGYLKVGVSYFNPSESRFKDIYGNGIQFEGELAIHVWKGFELWFGGSYFKKEGVLTFTKEETDVKIIPLGGGVKYRVILGKISLYSGLGLSYYLFEEFNPVKDVSTNGIGYVGKLGSFVRIADRLILDFHVDYTHCEIQPENVKINIGGISASINLGFLF